jgi:hypothetical protein
MQVQNIVKAVLPRQELLDAEMELVLAHWEHEELVGFSGKWDK